MTPALASSTPEKIEGIHAVCLDIDETLVNSDLSMRRGLIALVGNDAAWSVWSAKTDEYYTRYLAGEIGFGAMRQERLRAFFAAFGENLDDGEVRRREEIRLAATRDSWQLYDDVLPCLEWLRAAGLRIAAVTNAPGGYQREKIAAVGLGGAFDELVISGERGAAKPAVEIFHTACAALGHEPAEVVHVGDGLEFDAMAARAAGLHGIWLDRAGSAATGRWDVPMITDLGQLPEMLVCDLPRPLAAPTPDRTPACTGARG